MEQVQNQVRDAQAAAMNYSRPFSWIKGNAFNKARTVQKGVYHNYDQELFAKYEMNKA